ncbi:MAG: PH domain-containing protein [Mycobacteriales bacterium]
MPPRYAVLAGVGAAAFVLAALGALFTGDRLAVGVAAAAGLVLAALAVRDRLVPVRLTADADGVTVVEGVARLRRIPWSDVDGLSVQGRGRNRRSGRLLEIDTGDRVHLVSGRELGAEPSDVLAALDQIRTGRLNP